MKHLSPLEQAVRTYFRRYHWHALGLAGLQWLLLALVLALVLMGLEYLLWLPTWGRAVMFWGLGLGVMASGLYLLLPSLAALLRPMRTKDWWFAAQELRRHLPDELKDEVQNYFSLKWAQGSADSDLIGAALEQKSLALRAHAFLEYLDWKTWRRSLYILLALIFLWVIGTLQFPAFFVRVPVRVWNYDMKYSKQSPLVFVWDQGRAAIYGEPYELSVGLKVISGALPKEMFLLWEGKRLPFESFSGQFLHRFDQVQGPIRFQLEAGNTFSEPYEIPMRYRPGVEGLTLSLEFPSYLNRKPEEYKSMQALEVPEGTQMTWDWQLSHVDEGLWLSDAGQRVSMQAGLLGKGFRHRFQALRSFRYALWLKNAGMDWQKSAYFPIKVLPDQFPSLRFSWKADSLYYRFLVFHLQASDDHGLGQMRMQYQIIKQGKTGPLKSKNLELRPGLMQQSLVQVLSLDSMNLGPKDQVQVQFWLSDRDGLHGPKWSKSAWVHWEYPSKQGIDAATQEQFDRIEKALETATQQAEALKKAWTDLEKQWQLGKSIDPKVLDALRQKEAQWQEQIKELKAMQEAIMGKQMSTRPVDPPWLKKMETIQQLLDQLLKESPQQKEDFRMPKMENLWQKRLENLKERQRGNAQELKRLEQFYKELKLEQMTQRAIQDLEDLAKKQEDLAKEMQAKPKPTSQDQNAQESIQKAAKEAEEDRKAIEKEAGDDAKEWAPDVSEQDQQSLEKTLEEIQQDIKQGKSGKSIAQKQQKASKSMQQMAKQMQAQQQERESMQLDVDMAKLRLWMDDVLQLSFGQEQLMMAFRTAQPGEATQRQWAQRQVQLSQAAKAIEDSLQALSKRVLPLSAVITKEVNAMRQSLDQAAKVVRDRKWEQVAYRQQEAMSGINRVAVMLSDLLRQLQAQQQEGKPGKGKSQKGKQQGNWGQRQQALQQKARQQGKQAGGMKSEEIIQWMQEQSRLRQELEQKMRDLSANPGAGELQEQLEKLAKEMKKNEDDVLKKALNTDFQQRQERLMPQLMEAEKALKEQNEDPKRQAKSPQERWRENPPPNLKPYLQEMQKQRDLYQKVPVELRPFYQEKVEKFLQSIKSLPLK